MKESEYNQQQIEAFVMVRNYFGGLSQSQIRQVKTWVRNYLRFRADVRDFQDLHFSEVCIRKCFTSNTGACCNREGIATFFADVVINVLLSSDKEIDAILRALMTDSGGFKCIYLAEKGCLWHLKPIVCEMFLCSHAKKEVLEGDDDLLSQWKKLRRRERRFTWPSRPVLFDKLERLFIEAGFDSPLMYFHHGPGLLRVKKRFLKKRSKRYP